MRYLVVSDIHSNWEALKAVLDDAKDLYERIVCCGDLVGYGPDPNGIVEWARESVHATIRGNHDRACAGMADLEDFNPIAKAACVWTMNKLDPENREYLAQLPQGPLSEDGFQLLHGSPLDEDEYLTTAADVRNIFEYLQTNVSFFGHTHLQGGFSRADGTFQIMSRIEGRRAELLRRLARDGVHLINPGSVGQPRDGDPRAAYALFDSETLDLEQRRVRYDVKTTQRKIEGAGLPEILARRLAAGR